MIEVKQMIERLEAATFKAKIEVEGKEYVYTYARSNAIFPAYKSLVEVLRKYYDDEVLLETNCKQLATELEKAPNRNTTLLNMFDDVVTKNNLTVTIVDKL